MLGNLIADVNGRAFSLVKVVDVSQLPIELSERREGQMGSMQLEITCSCVGLEYSVDVIAG